MRYHKKSIIAFLLFFQLLVSCANSQHITVLNSNKLVEQFNSDNYTLYYTSRYIDSRLIKYMKKERNFDLIMADTGRLLNPTDMTIEGFPDKRIIVTGKGSNGLNFILFEYGENLTHNTCILYKKQSRNKYLVTILNVQDSIKTVKQLKTLCSSKVVE